MPFPDLNPSVNMWESRTPTTLPDGQLDRIQLDIWRWKHKSSMVFLCSRSFDKCFSYLLSSVICVDWSGMLDLGTYLSMENNIVIFMAMLMSLKSSLFVFIWEWLWRFLNTIAKPIYKCMKYGAKIGKYSTVLTKNNL